MIFCKYVFFSTGVLNKHINQGQTLSRVLIGYDFRLLIKVLFISPTRMRASTLNFFNPPDTRLRRLKVEHVISAREMNKNYNG